MLLYQMLDRTIKMCALNGIRDFFRSTISNRRINGEWRVHKQWHLTYKKRWWIFLPAFFSFVFPSSMYVDVISSLNDAESRTAYGIWVSIHGMIRKTPSNRIFYINIRAFLFVIPIHSRDEHWLWRSTCTTDTFTKISNSFIHKTVRHNFQFKVSGTITGGWNKNTNIFPLHCDDRIHIEMPTRRRMKMSSESNVAAPHIACWISNFMKFVDSRKCNYILCDTYVTDRYADWSFKRTEWNLTSIPLEQHMQKWFDDVWCHRTHTHTRSMRFDSETVALTEADATWKHESEPDPEYHFHILRQMQFYGKS